MNKIKILAILAAIFVFAAIYSTGIIKMPQSKYGLEVKVVSGSLNNPVEGASVSIIGMGTIVTGEDGIAFFSFKEPGFKQITITVTKAGYTTYGPYSTGFNILEEAPHFVLLVDLR